MDRDSVIILITIVGVAIAAYLEHRALWPRWRRYEWPRRALGICTVLGFLFGAALMGALDLTTIVVTFGAFGVAGGIVGLSLTAERAAVNQNARGDLARGEGENTDGTSRGSGSSVP